MIMSPMHKRVTSFTDTTATSPLTTQPKIKSLYNLRNGKHQKVRSLLLNNSTNKLGSPLYKAYSNTTKMQRLLSTSGITKQLITSSLSNCSLTKSVIKPLVNKPMIIKKKSKFPMIFAGPSFKLESIYPSDEKLYKMNHESKVETKEESRKIFLRSFNLIDKNKFSPSFQRILDSNNHLLDSEIERTVSRTVKKNITVSYKAKTQVDIIEKDEKKKHNTLLLGKLKSLIIRAAINFKRLNISIEDFYTKYKPNSISFSDANSKSLFFSIKTKDLPTITSLLYENRFLVLDYDHFKQTPLHWAAKRNFFKAVILIAEQGACINAVDCIGRTPLHLAVLMNSIESALLLIMEGASTMIVDSSGKKPIDYCKSELMKDICNRGMLLNVIHFLGKQKVFYQNVKRGMMYFIVNEMRHNINRELVIEVRKRLEVNMV